MSATARKLTPAKLLAVLVFAVTVSGAVSLNAVCAQADQVTQMVARVHAATPGKLPADAFPLAQTLLVERRYNEAYQLFAALLEKLPREPAALYGAALAAFNLGRAADAEPLAQSAVAVFLEGVPGSALKSMKAERRQRAVDSLVLLAVILGARGDDSQALKTVERAVALEPNHYDAQFTLGRALYTVGDSAGAAKAFAAALRIKPDDARALFFLATTLEAAGETEAAARYYSELARRHPHAAEGHLGLGVMLVKRGGADVGRGIEELRTAIRLDPNQYEAQVNLGRALLTQKLPAESIVHFQRAAELWPGNPEPHYQLAIAYRRLGLADKATEQTAIVKRIHEARRVEGPQNNNSAKPQ
ncbi:MAG TPA: tetratricopeptide repeat protein [Pyrinomonadaceae bacterium]